MCNFRHCCEAAEIRNLDCMLRAQVLVFARAVPLDASHGNPPDSGYDGRS